MHRVIGVGGRSIQRKCLNKKVKKNKAQPTYREASCSQRTHDCKGRNSVKFLNHFA